MNAKNLTSKSTSELLRMLRTEIDDATASEIHRIVQSRKGKDFPVGLASLLNGR